MSEPVARAIPEPAVWQVAVDGVAIKQLHFVKAGYVARQHVHAHDHHTMLARGSLRAWIDGVEQPDYVAPRPILIRKGCKHTFLALEDDTIAYCIHNLHGKEEVEILAEAEPFLSGA